MDLSDGDIAVSAMLREVPDLQSDVFESMLEYAVDPDTPSAGLIELIGETSGSESVPEHLEFSDPHHDPDDPDDFEQWADDDISAGEDLLPIDDDLV